MNSQKNYQNNLFAVATKGKILSLQQDRLIGDEIIRLYGKGTVPEGMKASHEFVALHPQFKPGNTSRIHRISKRRSMDAFADALLDVRINEHDKSGWSINLLEGEAPVHTAHSTNRRKPIVKYFHIVQISKGKTDSNLIPSLFAFKLAFENAMDAALGGNLRIEMPASAAQFVSVVSMNAKKLEAKFQADFDSAKGDVLQFLGNAGFSVFIKA